MPSLASTNLGDTQEDIETDLDEFTTDDKSRDTIVIGGKKFTKGRSSTIDKELEDLVEIVEAESGHW